MRAINLVLLVLFAIGSYGANIPKNKDQDVEDSGENFFKLGKKWVVLIAGSNGWFNYRHQADICHAYQIVKENGIPEENIITMMVDDIAYNEENPTPGKIINSPNGTNIYNGIVIDYKGEDVTPENFLNIIKGNASAMFEIGSGKVVNGGPLDKVFINFVGHGSDGLLVFQEDILFADDLNDAFNYMYLKNSYSKVLLFIESCNAGSMFDGILRDDNNILAITASGPRESSYACYYDDEIYYTYLGDEFSVTWMENLNMTLVDFLKRRNIFNDFSSVRHLVQMSNVMAYGDFDVGFKRLSCFIGHRKSAKSTAYKTMSDIIQDKKPIPSQIVNADEIKYQSAGNKMTSEEKKELAIKIRHNKEMKSMIDNAFNRIYSLVILERPEIQNIIGEFNKPKQLSLSLDMFPCYKSLINTISESCFSVPKNPYSFNKLKIIANMCIVDKQIHETIGHLIKNKACVGISKTITNVH